MAAKISSDCSLGEDWAAYYKKTGYRPPRPTLLRALDAFSQEASSEDLLAVDLGCGSGRDTIEILRRGWRVLAIDASKSAFRELFGRHDLPDDALIGTQLARFEEMELPPCDLVNAGFSLPLCAKESFPAVWAKILKSLRPGGRFSGQFYGNRDSWAVDPELTILTLNEVKTYLASLELEFFEEEEEDSITPRGRSKHWHIFQIVARKKMRA